MAHQTYHFLSDIGASSSSHTHNYASKVTLAGTDYSCVSNAITITKANLQTAIGSTGLGLMTERNVVNWILSRFLAVVQLTSQV